MYKYKEKGDAQTDPPVIIDWMEFLSIFGDVVVDQRSDGNVHLTNYQEVIVRLHNTWAANKEMAYGNAELINKLRKKIKKAKKALKA